MKVWDLKLRASDRFLEHILESGYSGRNLLKWARGKAKHAKQFWRVQRNFFKSFFGRRRQRESASKKTFKKWLTSGRRFSRLPNAPTERAETLRSCRDHWKINFWQICSTADLLVSRMVVPRRGWHQEDAKESCWQRIRTSLSFNAAPFEKQRVSEFQKRSRKWLTRVTGFDRNWPSLRRKVGRKFSEKIQTQGWHEPHA